MRQRFNVTGNLKKFYKIWGTKQPLGSKKKKQLLRPCVSWQKSTGKRGCFVPTWAQLVIRRYANHSNKLFYRSTPASSWTGYQLVFLVTFKNEFTLFYLNCCFFVWQILCATLLRSTPYVVAVVQAWTAREFSSLFCYTSAAGMLQSGVAGRMVR